MYNVLYQTTVNDKRSNEYIPGDFLACNDTLVSCHIPNFTAPSVVQYITVLLT
jgi:hypothetical protein